MKDTVRLPIGEIAIEGDLRAPPRAAGVVLFAHGSGSSRHSPRNRFVAAELNEAGLATLLIDLLTTQEEALDSHTAHLLAAGWFTEHLAPPAESGRSPAAQGS